ncbi:methylmalonyl-CoA mutase family protein [Roseospira visakhapatnamensis]|uniref:methylmalonyl-CoA mutase n=1 Tax=Roseospira visakhapatnamensis TaxID=390880 RepID=A0A7W6RBH7_9PROT|nr:methylmalonyl-CoA mutase family protein [Roseospira visakhapatnamensis]MBB4265302.1 methylmalonyl-CoA mutase [Roseospira visakhapatnamensis]
MTDASLPLAGDFPPASHADWLALVEKALDGAPFDKKLVARTLDGIAIQPLYTREHWPAEGDPSGMPGAMPFTRGGRPLAQAMSGWDIRQPHANPDVAATQAAMDDDLDNGVTSLLLRLDAAGRAGLDADDPAAADLFGEGGLSLSSVAEMDALLSGVDLTSVPLAFDAGAQAPTLAAMTVALWCQRGVKEEQARGAFNIDPLGTLATAGRLPADLDTTLGRMAAIARNAATTFPKGAVTAVGVDTAPYYNAGASEAQDLACAMATGVAYLRALEAGGLSLDDASRQIAFTVSLGTDQLLSIAKLRAARLMWARITEACGVGEPARAARIHAVTATRVLTRRDPWVNLLRGTISCFSAAVGGADGITVPPHDAALGLPTRFSRRIARNTQLILQEESQLNRVIDPAGGSWALEHLTEDLAGAAWTLFQAIEADGGMARALESGRIAEQIAEVREARRKDIAKRKAPITGVSEFAKLDEQAPELAALDLSALRAAAGTRLATTRASATADPGALGATATPADLATAAIKGATLGALAQATTDGTGTTVAPLPPHSLAEDFEALRDAADAHLTATGARPRVFLANLGPIAHHTARATYAANLFAAGGIESLTNEGFRDADACAAAFKDSGAGAAVLCSSDKVYDDLAEATARALKAAGCRVVLLAGRPGDKQDAYTAAGIDRFIYMGCDVLGTLRGLHADLGVTSR